jgi:hypothetical protein
MLTLLNDIGFMSFATGSTRYLPIDIIGRLFVIAADFE